MYTRTRVYGVCVWVYFGVSIYASHPTRHNQSNFFFRSYLIVYMDANIYFSHFFLQININKWTFNEMLNILDLHDDALSAIFDQCTVDEVLRLYYVCRKFREIIIQNTFLRKSRDLLLVGHRNKQAISYQRYFIFLVHQAHVYNKFPPFAEHCVTYPITNVSNCSKTGAKDDMKNIYCAIENSSIPVIYIWSDNGYTQHMVVNCGSIVVWKEASWSANSPNGLSDRCVSQISRVLWRNKI